MDWQNLSKEECVKKLETNQSKGLSTSQVKKRLEQYGTNELTHKKKNGFFKKFISQFSDFMVIILLIAATVSFITSLIRHDMDFIDSIIILTIVVVNAFTGVIQESRAEKAIEALKKLSSPQATVLRDGKEMKIDSSGLVPGDIVVLSTGDMVPADLRILESYSLKAEESALTGESVPVEKSPNGTFSADTPIGDRTNMLFSGSSVTAGRGKGVVVATAMKTEVGKIAHMINTEETPQTPLQNHLAKTSKILGIGALIICGIIFILGLFQHISPLEMFMISISLAVAAIPEGLPVIVTIVLAMGVKRMATNRAIIRRLPAVETLGGASVICSDKTGTLTQNKMTVVEMADSEHALDLRGTEPEFILNLAVLCNNCTVSAERVNGDPTEAALVIASKNKKNVLEQQYPRIKEIPFSSDRKRMTTIHRLHTGGYRIITKGAPDVLLNLCTGVHIQNNSHTLTASVKNRIMHRNSDMASRSLRVLGVAYKDVTELPSGEKMIESNLTFCGLIGMIDPPRPEAKEAVRMCKQAGIRPVMITGDHVATATAIGRELGILDENGMALTGAQLDQMEQHQLEKEIYKYCVYARVSPAHKVRIVKAFQARGEVVAMTGDGVNDAPALKAADIGCAMGQSGTDVAKGASDLILTDDNFSTIVSAVREGRGIYENIRKTIHFLISCNIGEIMTILVAFIFGMPSPLLAIQLLWVNLVTDSLPALALGVDPIDDDIMQRKPSRQSKSLFGNGMGYNIVVEGCMIGALSLLAFTIGRVFFDGTGTEPLIGRTMAFAVLSLSQVAHAFNMRSEHSIFHIGVFKNRKLVIAALACIALQASVILIPPLSAVFKTAHLGILQWAIVIGLALVPIVVVEIEKLLFRMIRALFPPKEKSHKKVNKKEAKQL